ncbi:hypothetical protein ACFQT0_28520 [Hymenobacter humi]|uniref:Uncharacterized protein n=1 Tax=Hymenobacter humi TaxID=1411620 RepID=A0ABW2UDE6_9BACT
MPRLLLEQAYTFLNRLTALRLAEEREIVMECLRRGQQSEGFVELFSIYTDRAYDTGDARYAAFVRANFDRMARELPGLFGAYSPYGLLWPRQAAFDTVLAHLRRPELAFAWDADETLGWLYQYFNSDAERQEMRARSRAPRTSREMAVRNQFFTPRYVVEFLTDNTLGRRWLDVAGTSEALLARCRYLTLKAETLPTAAPAEAPAPAAATPERRAAPALNEEPEPFALPDPRRCACSTLPAARCTSGCMPTTCSRRFTSMPGTACPQLRCSPMCGRPWRRSFRTMRTPAARLFRRGYRA